MTVARFAISLDKELARQIRRSAAREPMSTWFADAARRKLQSEGLKSVVEEWEAIHGRITDEELDAAERLLRAAKPAGPRRRRAKAKRTQRR